MNNRSPLFWIISLFGLLFFTACKNNKDIIDPDFHFELVDGNESGVSFDNKLTESDSVNFLTNQYIYIGSGVGIGDFNQDGLQDIFFAGEQVSSKLYINLGNFKFEDVTKSAGVATSRWCTGVSVVDINSDGMPDVYLSVSHARDPALRKNYLFINESKRGAPASETRFTEQGGAYGLDDNSFSTQAAFFDYDLDGDLDMYLMNHNVYQNQPNNIVVTNAVGTSVAADKLYRNEGTGGTLNHPLYKDVTMEAGIRDFGYGLGIAVSDVNKDGWPDVYIANDFLNNDILWINHKGRFINSIAKTMNHQSYNSMGVDAADINNDALPDIAVLDMQPETNYRKKTMVTGMNSIKYEMEQKSGSYQPQFVRNMLQLNQGIRTIDSMKQPFYSEIGQLSGISETDWSWSVLMADFDNDGWKDIQVTNGIAKDLTNNDFLFFRSNLLNQDMSSENPSRGNGTFDIPKLRKQLDKYGTVKTDNYFFSNQGGITFSNKTEAVGMSVPSISHGAAYVDLDNDGDLDLVTNNMNQEAFIWKNQARRSAADSTHNFVSIKLNGIRANPSGFGATLTLYAGGKVQYLEQNPVRGYLSTMDERLYFGLDRIEAVDSLMVTWQDGSQQVIRNIKANRFITLDQKAAVRLPNVDVNKMQQVLFTDAGQLLDTSFRHDEVSFFDYATQRLLPQKYSQLGPALASGDVNGDGLLDFFIGGGSFQSGRIYFQTGNGKFISKDLVERNKTSEDLAAVFFDADGDKDLDLLITEGSSEYGNSNSLDRPRLYLNDGRGEFSYDESAIPGNVSTVSQTVVAADYDKDGDFDLFVGGRILANQYPASPRSFILQNDKGKFTDVTQSVCPALVKPGMITAAVWLDVDNDQSQDLVICGEWMPVRTFRNLNGRLQEVTEQSGIGKLNGMWRSLTVADLDMDGDMDLVAGNLGNNNKFRASGSRPYQLFAKDIDKNGTVDIIPAYHIRDDKGEYHLFPAIDQTEFSQEVPTIKKKYLLNADYARVTMDDLFKGIDRKEIVELRCDTTASLWMENTGNGKFRPRALPIEAQFAPVNTIIARDFTQDGVIDLLLAGNEYHAETASGRYDASYGQLLRGDGHGAFTSVRPLDAGLVLDGHIKQMQVVESKVHGPLLLVAVNADNLQCFKMLPDVKK